MVMIVEGQGSVGSFSLGWSLTIPIVRCCGSVSRQTKLPCSEKNSKLTLNARWMTTVGLLSGPLASRASKRRLHGPFMASYSILGLFGHCPVESWVVGKSEFREKGHAWIGGLSRLDDDSTRRFLQSF